VAASSGTKSNPTDKNASSTRIIASNTRKTTSADPDRLRIAEPQDLQSPLHHAIAHIAAMEYDAQHTSAKNHRRHRHRYRVLVDDRVLAYPAGQDRA
jgi:hypothetical protein